MEASCSVVIQTVLSEFGGLGVTRKKQLEYLLRAKACFRK